MAVVRVKRDSLGGGEVAWRQVVVVVSVVVAGLFCLFGGEGVSRKVMLEL